MYLQLEALKDKHQRNGNRRMVLILTAMQHAANTSIAPNSPTSAATPTPITTAVVTEKNGGNQPSDRPKESQQKEEKQKRGSSKKERRCSDGVVIKPYVNNILASVTDKIVCATFQEGCLEDLNGGKTVKEEEEEEEVMSKARREDVGGGGDGGKAGRNVCTLRRTKSRETAVDRRERRRREDFFPSCRLEGGGTAEASGGTGRSLPTTPSSPHPPLPPQQDSHNMASRISKGPKYPTGSLDISYGAGSSFSSQSVSSQSEEDPSGACRTPLQLGYRNADFLLRKSVSSELTERVCRSLEYLDEGGVSRGPGGTPGGTEEDPSLEDRSVRSAHSTPRRSQGRRFREIRDPERARAFILYSLSDRATLTDEVTV